MCFPDDPAAIAIRKPRGGRKTRENAIKGIGLKKEDERMMTLQEVIVESHDDFPIWSSVVVGFDDDKSLVVLLEHDDYD